MTAYDNLAYLRYVRGYPDVKRIDEVLDLVGLSGSGKKKCQEFSIGMRQRLGIAMALLTKPEVLILDEPVNGLDPEGMVEIKRILKRISKEEKTTILISSPLLSELSEVCTDFSLISHGKLIENLSAKELMVKCRGHISLKTNDINRTAAFLEEKFYIHDYKVLYGEEIHIFEQLDRIEQISKEITDSGLVITKICEEGQNLEEYYMEKVGEKNV